MRVLITVAAIMISVPAQALDPTTFRLSNGGNLVELCGLPVEDPLHVNAMEFCNGYLTGAFHYYEATTLGSGGFICAPNPRPRPAQVMKGFVAWAKARPQYLQDRAIDTLFRYLGEAYPCR